MEKETLENLEKAKANAGAAWSEEMELVFKAAYSLNDKKPDPDKFVDKYNKGYNNRPSVRGKKKPSAVKPDSIFSDILKIIHGPDYDAEFAVKSHSQLMTLENLLGDLLEEYLALNMAADGWVCCWGSSVQSVDFCNKDGRLLQVKTSSNSENSSSKAVREGTTIDLWFRRVATKGEYNWAKLKDFSPSADVSEAGFRRFVKDVLEKNPNCYTKAEAKSSSRRLF